MNSFKYEYPVRQHFGKGCAESAIKAEMKSVGQHVLLAYGGGSLKRTGLYDKIIASSTTSQRHCRDTASKTPNSCHYSNGKTTSFSLLLLPTPNDMGRRRIHAAFILYKTLGYPELGHSI